MMAAAECEQKSVRDGGGRRSRSSGGGQARVSQRPRQQPVVETEWEDVSDGGSAR